MAVTHRFDSDLEDPNLDFNDWAEDNLTIEQFEDFMSKKDDMDEIMDYYHMWIKSQKLTHTVIREDGTEYEVCHKDIP